MGELAQGGGMIFTVDGARVDPVVLRTPGYWYVGSPYSRYPDGIEAAFVAVARITGRLIALGINAHSPIAHTHPVAAIAGLDPLDHALWMRADRPLMDGAVGLIVARIETWRESRGLAEEIEYFERAGKPIIHLDPRHE